MIIRGEKLLCLHCNKHCGTVNERYKQCSISARLVRPRFGCRRLVISSSIDQDNVIPFEELQFLKYPRDPVELTLAKINNDLERFLGIGRLFIDSNLMLEILF